MATLLKIGADVSGAEKVEKLAKNLREAADATDRLSSTSQKGNQEFKTMSSTMGAMAEQANKVAKDLKNVSTALGSVSAYKDTFNKSWFGGSFNTDVKTFANSMQDLSRDLAYSSTELTNFITTSGKYAVVAKENASATYAASAALRAQAVAIAQIEGLDSKYVAALAKESLLNNEAAISLAAKTAAINSQVAAYQKLNATGRVGSYEKGGDYAASLQAENASIAAQERGLATLASQFASLKAVKTALKQGDYAAQIVSENASIAAQERGLKELEAQFKRTAVARAALKQGSYAVSDYAQSGRDRLSAGSTAGGYDYAKQMKEESRLYDEVSGKMKTQSSTLTQLGDAWDSAGRKASSFHDLMRGASGAMGTLWMTYGQMIPMISGFAVAAGTMATVTKGADLDYTARSIELLAYGYTTLRDNAELATVSLEGTKKAILSIQDTPFTAGELGTGILEFSRAGYKDLEQNLKNIDQASKFAYIGQVDLAGAVELVVGQMSAFKDIGGDAGAAFNTMAVVADKTSISLQQVSEAFKNTTSLGTVMGMEFNDIAVALGVMGQAGIRGATAGAALNTMMYKLVAPTATAQRKMRELGIEFEAFDAKSGKMKSIKTIAFELANLTKNLNTKEVSGVFEAMVGLRGVKALGALVQMASQGSKEFDALSEAVKKSGGYLDGYMDILNKSGKNQIAILKADFDRLFAANYDNASVVEALKNLRVVVSDPSIKQAMALVTSGVINITSSLTKLISLDPVAFTAGLGIIGIIAGRHPAVATVTTAVAGLKILDNYINKNRESITGKAQTSSALNPFAAWTEYSDSVSKLFTSSEAGLNKVKTSAAEAKKILLDVAGAKLEAPIDIDAAGLQRLEAVGEYFDNLKDKIHEINKTPVQLIDAQVEKEVSNMFSKFAEGGFTLQQMVAISKELKDSIGKTGEEGSSAAKQIGKISEELGKVGGNKNQIKEVQDNLTLVAKAMHVKEIEKANKEMLASMRKEWQGYADKVIDLQDKIAGNQRSLAEELRAIDQSNMTGVDLWKDKKKEAQEYASIAKKAAEESAKAFASGDTLTGQKQYATSEEYLKKAMEAAKALNTEIKGGSQALDTQADKAKSYLEILNAQKATLEARGGSNTSLDATIKKAEAAYKVLEAQKNAAESQTLITKPQGAEEAKRILTELYDQQLKLQQITQDNYKSQMQTIQTKANETTGKSVDMTEGMDAAKAAWISTLTEVKTEAAKLAPEITSQLATINMPTDNWKSSIFNMKGVFVTAVDEMALKLNSEFSNEKNVTRFSNAVPTKEYVDALNALNNIKVQPVTPETVTNTQSVKDNIVTFSAALQTAGDYVTNTLVGSLLGLGTTITDNLDIAKGMNASGVEEFLTNTRTSLNSLAAGIADSNLGENLSKSFTDNYDAMTKVNSAFVDSLGQGWKDTNSIANEQLDGITKGLETLVNKDWTVKVNVVEARSLGGMIGAYQNGGMIQALAAGGSVKNMLGGGYLPGFGGGDRNVLLGENGEVMLNKWAVAKGTAKTALAYNKGDFKTVVNNLLTQYPNLLTGYTNGGYISGGGQASSAATTSTQAIAGYSAFIDFSGASGQRGRVYGTMPSIKLLEREITKVNKYRSGN